MHPAQSNTVAEPFFLNVEPGRRFCMYRGPAGGTCRGAFVHVPAFAEEMNKSRRMTALQARRFAEQGIASVQIDLFGTGDSDGDFGDARWDLWIQDVVAAGEWLTRRTGSRVGLWGLRLGALLAAQVAHLGVVQSDALVLWQPVTNGELFLTQFLRLRVATSMLAEGAERIDTAQMRKAIGDGESLEIAGYLMAPELAKRIDELRLAEFAPRTGHCTWLEIAAAEGAEPSPASRRVIEGWRKQGSEINAQTVVGAPFWSSVEIAECAALIDATAEVNTVFG